ncbi:TPA: hypothetical protein ACHSX8_005400 [Klebsiella pneumoniae]
MQKTYEILHEASAQIESLMNVTFDSISLGRPETLDEAINNTKIISKLSPLMGNLIEFKVCNYLNETGTHSDLGYWERQDPSFPDTIFQSQYVKPNPGIEIKAWYPLSTEITARFKDSQDHFLEDQINVALICWMPEFIVYGKPMIIGSVVISAKSVAEARDNHYSNPPDYLIVEPGDTSDRTLNLQQTNTNGYKFQGTNSDFEKACDVYNKWLQEGYERNYSTDKAYQLMVEELMSRFKYRLDTNFAKIDRIRHNDIENFKSRILNTIIHGESIVYWSRLLSRGSVDDIKRKLSSTLGIEY